MKSAVLTGIVCVILSASPRPGLAQQRGETRGDPATAGSVTGRVVFRGTPPPQDGVSMSNDSFCAQAAESNLPSEAVLIDPQGGLQNAFVYVKDGLDPSYVFEAPATAVALDQRRCRFEPRVLGVRIGQPLAIINDDATLHNVHGRPSANQEFNIGQPIAGMRYTRAFTVPEVMIPLTSDIHSWMKAFVGVLPHPLFAVTGPDGSFTIGGVPPGSYTIEAWHEKLGRVTERVTVSAGQAATVSFTFPDR
jgi:plastocyanin